MQRLNNNSSQFIAAHGPRATQSQDGRATRFEAAQTGGNAENENARCRDVSCRRSLFGSGSDFGISVAYAPVKYEALITRFRKN